MTIMQEYIAVTEREAMRLDPFGGALDVAGLAKHHVSIDLEGGAHEEHLQHLEAQKKALETVVAKYPLLQQGLKEGWAEIRLHNGDLGIHYNGQRSVSAGAGEADAEVEKKRAADHRNRRTFAKAADPVDDAELSDPSGF